MELVHVYRQFNFLKGKMKSENNANRLMQLVSPLEQNGRPQISMAAAVAVTRAGLCSLHTGHVSHTAVVTVSKPPGINNTFFSRHPYLVFTYRIWIQEQGKSASRRRERPTLGLLGF